MHRLFISDLHLDPSREDLTAAFTGFLERRGRQAEDLYILGDLFSYWTGDRDASGYHLSVARTLRDLPVRKFFIPGNRDFLLGRRFCARCGMTLLQDNTVLEDNGLRILLCHGDGLCTLDVAYQKFRRFRSRPLNLMLYSLLPRFIRLRMASRVREDAREEKSTKTPEMMDVCQADLLTLMEELDTRICIHGHTHRPGHHLLPGNMIRLVLGDWRRDGFEFLLQEDRRLSLIHADPAGNERLLFALPEDFPAGASGPLAGTEDC